MAEAAANSAIQVANNVIRGPWNRSTPSVTITSDDGSTNIVTPGVSLVKHNHITETLLTIVPLLFNNIELAGFNIDLDDNGDDTIKDGTLIVESIRSLLYKHYDMYHPLQDVSEAIFEPGDPGTLKMADRLDVDLGEMEDCYAVDIVDNDPDAIEE